MCFEEHSQWTANNPVDDFGDNVRKVDASVIPGIVSRTLLIDGHDTMELTSPRLHPFVENPPNQNSYRHRDHYCKYFQNPCGQLVRSNSFVNVGRLKVFTLRVRMATKSY